MLSAEAERFLRQVWFEDSSLLPGFIVIQSANSDAIALLRSMNLISEAGILFDTMSIGVAVDALRDAGFEAVLLGGAEDAYARLQSDIFEPSLSFDPKHRLYRFQARQIAWHKDSDPLLLNWDTGTGKTVGAIALMCLMFDRDEIDKAFVWCPSHLVRSWHDALCGFSSLSVGRLDKGTTQKRLAAIDAFDKQVAVINYEKARCEDGTRIIERFRKERVLFIYDEVQRLKNRKSQMHKSIREMVKSMHIVRQIGLSATPVERTPEDLYNIFRILKPDIFGTVKEFESRYTLFGGARDRYFRYVGFCNIDDMRIRVAPYISHARKSDAEIASEFPEMQEILIGIEMSPQDAAIYGTILDKARDDADDSSIAYYVSAALRCCSLPESLLLSHVPEIQQAASKHDPDSRYSQKLEALKEMLGQIRDQGSKAIVFYTFTHHGILLLQHRLAGFNPLVFYGGLTRQEKEAVIERFKGDPDACVLLASDAGREGLNLPEAEYVIHYNTPYLWSHYRQRSDRIHRIDSFKRTVFSYRFVTYGTLEERVEGILSERRALSVDLGLDDVGEMPEVTPADARYLLFGRSDGDA